MKTMLKRKQRKAGFLCYGFFLLTSPAITGITQDPFYATNATAHFRNQTETARFTDTSLNKLALTDSTNISVANKAEEKKSAKAPAVRLNPNATKFVKDYVSKNASYLDEIKERSDKYFPVMDKVFTSYNLPTELKYLAVIESELRQKATSHVGAVGLWQLMPGTAKMLGLKVSSKYDERRLSYKSTKAAAMYLNDLHKQFGDWLLVIAAYNSGPGPVYTAIKKSGSRNFWRLQQFLPLETRLHVKRFIGTHYYFEGTGSITTLTKAEAMEHLKAIEKFEEETNEALVQDTATQKTSDDNVPVAMVQ
jgi:membrane-bound lytic murein transglycosylase D